ncbi:MAG: Ig-like domain-containing protein [Promethearchaeota archaeon]
MNNLPSFGSITDNGDGTGLITFTPGFTDMGVYPNIEVIASDDGTPSLSDTTAFTLTVTDSNRAPHLTPIPDTTMNEGDTLNVPVSSSDLDGNNITLTVNGLPSFGNLLDNGDGTGVIIFTPGFEDSGTYNGIEMIAFDNGNPNLSDTVYFNLIVINMNRAPVLSNISDTTVNVGETLQISVSATDPDGDVIILDSLNFPPFVNFSDNGDGTGMITFTPSSNNIGLYSNIQVLAID